MINQSKSCNSSPSTSDDAFGASDQGRRPAAPSDIYGDETTVDNDLD
jgi:hypothetical protein